MKSAVEAGKEEREGREEREEKEGREESETIEDCSMIRPCADKDRRLQRPIESCKTSCRTLQLVSMKGMDEDG